MRKQILCSLVVLAMVILSLPAAYATCGGGGGGGMGGMMPRAGYTGNARGQSGNGQPKAYFVPWKVLTAEEPALSTPIVLYWFPASAGEMQSGDLVTSRMLILFSAQCVGMQLVRPDDTATIDKWSVAGKLPTALLVSDGKAIAHVDSKDGLLTLSDVENMVHRELWARETALESDLAEARKKVDAGDRDGAIAVYRRVWDQRCLVPAKGREAQKALGRLGIRLAGDALRAADPVMTPQMNRRMTAAMDRAFAAELAGEYARARSLYLAASKIDPADPVPPRFLGELYRHQTGEWTLARATFERILTMQPDPLSRAVALHGLGKMIIHMGDSSKGLELFHESIAAYPLALTYRNLAVYWNSERQRDKADGYVRKALALDPEDPYNLVFAATYMADSGRKEEALRIARQNENLLAASYNLAAIYALAGNKGKAMELLKRHFYRYERYDEVRAMEMWEARVDYVFASMKDDPEFVKLTVMAR